MKTSYLLLPLLALFVACGSASSDKAPEKFTSASENGLAVGTITFESATPKNDIYRFLYEPQSDDSKFVKKNDGKIEIKSRNGKKRGFTGDFANGQSYVFVIERAPGKYAFNQHTVLTGLGSMGQVNYSKKYAVPFEIKKGEITYLGELSYNDLSEPGTPRIVVYDRFDRDLNELKMKYPNIDWNAAIDKTAKSGNNGEGIIDFR
ncbi:hypothetical protein R1T16_09575 [Flavobacterium sp. DG1-102-2]|uniref:hypothetical protein n=1 Tax=Flavobacterium sp. DG1-102-2 TaxID=3081663 RepID=UPI00294A0F69|nr:hypothetical protein [Flavobacterium sp. DG1-102-2]MDV6168673.1 hypothetical protein [Flavobacterium sp. DG1-102-2]